MKKSKFLAFAGLCLIFSLNMCTVSFAELKWIEVEGENFVADSFYGVDALYTENSNSGSDPTYSCAAYVKKFYSQIFGVDVYNLMDDGPPLLRDGGNSFEEVSNPKPFDIVFWPTSKNKNNHSAIVKEVKNDTVYLIEQNYKTGAKAGIFREIEYPSENFVFYRLKNEKEPSFFENDISENFSFDSINLTKELIEQLFEFYSEGNIKRVKASGRAVTDDDENVYTYKMEADDTVSFVLSQKSIYGFYLNEDEEWEEIPYGVEIKTNEAFFCVSGYDEKETDLENSWQEPDEVINSDNLYIENETQDKDFLDPALDESTNGSFYEGEEIEEPKEDERVLSAYYNEYAFSDVLPENWAYESIQKCVSEGYFKGYDDGSFKPFKSITRGEFAVLISKYLNKEEADKTLETYSDVKKTEWYYGYVENAKGYLDGTVDSNGNNIFLPKENAKREDICIAAVKAKGLKAENANLSFLRYFSDADSVSEKAKPYVALAVEAKIVNGFEDGTFRPNESITRAQAAVILSKIIN